MEWPLLDLLMRWAHFIGALIWVGHNYANVVQRPNYRQLLPEELSNSESEVFMGLLNREHGTFRYASIVVWVSGVAMLWQRGWLLDAVTMNGHYAVIGTGFWLGTLMVLNLWLVLWPHQKKVLGFVPAPLEERIRCSRITHLSSRTNTMLSIPLLLFMAASSHNLMVFG